MKIKIYCGGLKYPNKIKFCVILLLSLLLFEACSHQAQRKKAHILAQNIKVGETTQKQVRDLFGNPDYFGSRNVKQEDYSVEHTWWFYSFITEAGYKTLSLYFDDTGRVLDFRFATHP